MISDQPSAQLWKNQRIIDHHGLIVPEDRERLFENTECNNLLEDSLTIYQAKGLLPSHYMHYNMTSSSETETITYQAYVNYRCTKRDRKAGKTRVIGHLNILYRILRL